jgi:hypothetical protein
LTGAKLNGAKLTRARMPDNSIHKWKAIPQFLRYILVIKVDSGQQFAHAFIPRRKKLIIESGQENVPHWR